MSFRRRDDATVLDHLRQAGCLKLRFPGGDDPWKQAVTLNTSGGVAGGDRLHTRIRVLPDARASISSQAAERFYRALPRDPPAEICTRIDVAETGAAEWLPQETILFDRCAVDRRLEVGIAANAWFLGVEMLVFGRAAMGEIVEWACVKDSIIIRRKGRLLLHDTMRLQGNIAAMLHRPAVAAGARAVATLVHVAPDAEARVGAVRIALGGADAGASSWDGLLVARVVSADGTGLRRAVLRALSAVRGARPLPRVWGC